MIWSIQRVHDPTLLLHPSLTAPHVVWDTSGISLQRCTLALTNARWPKTTARRPSVILYPVRQSLIRAGRRVARLWGPVHAGEPVPKAVAAAAGTESLPGASGSGPWTPALYLEPALADPTGGTGRTNDRLLPERSLGGPQQYSQVGLHMSWCLAVSHGRP